MSVTTEWQIVSGTAYSLSERDFAGVVREHERMVFGIARNMLKETAAAEEVSQDVFLELFRQRESIESDEHLTHWLRRVTSNRCIDAIRRRRPTLALEQAPVLSVAEKVADPLMAKAVLDGLQTLPAEQRAAITLRYQEELALSEIAETLGLPLSTVKSHLHRGLRKLRARLETLSRRLAE